MGEVRTAPCEPWTTEEAVMALPSSCDLAPPPSPEIVARAIAVASEALYERTGRRWPGLCTTTVIVGTETRCRCGHPFLVWHECWPRRAEHTGAAMRLAHDPIVEVTSITGPDDVVLDEDTYAVEDWRWLVRLDEQRWPRGPLTVVYRHGRRPTPGGAAAATVLAGEVLRAAYPGSGCRLPNGVQSATRQGIAMAIANPDPAALFQSGLTGVDEVDLWLSSFPILRARRARIVTPDDVGVTHRRT